jgi:hypothetical protein
MPVIGEFVYVLAGALTGGGLWSVLRIAARGHSAVALERERAASAAQMLEQLPPGASFGEVDDAGRCRRITIPPAGKDGSSADEDHQR